MFTLERMIGVSLSKPHTYDEHATAVCLYIYTNAKLHSLANKKTPNQGDQMHFMSCLDYSGLVTFLCFKRMQNVTVCFGG